MCAAEDLARIGPPAQGAVPWLVRAIEHPENKPHAEILRHYAVRALGQIGPAAKAALPALNAVLENAEGNDFEVGTGPGRDRRSSGQDATRFSG
ncbi:MAG: HEAT repeat domain-containing protein [Isosphaeraceae bacterium]|nr:HEAT repeat domain-containing protein [Isosphaeraceae bacterium]